MPRSSNRSDDARRDRLGTVFMVSCILWALLVMAPPIIVMIIGLVMGTVPPEGAGGAWGYGPGYPIVTPIASLGALPAAGMLYLAVRTFPLPLRFLDTPSRSAMTVFSLFMGLTTALASMAMRDPSHITIDMWIGLVAAGAQFLAFVLFIARYVLGWLHLLPRSWRVPAPPSKDRQPTTIAGMLLAEEAALTAEAQKKKG